MYLVDTNVLSAGVLIQPVWTALVGWMDRNSEHLFISVITVAEIEAGIARARRTGADRKAERLHDWLQTLLLLYAARVLPLDIATARVLGRLMDDAHAGGRAPGLADLAIAATARHRGYTVLTRNLRHFSGLGVATHDPFASLPKP